MRHMLFVAIAAVLVSESSEQLVEWPILKECWTQWFDRDNPSGTGDWETLEHLREEHPGKICDKPLAIDVETLSGVDVADAGEVIDTMDTTSGFVCLNEQQRDRLCEDYRVRFKCEPSFCLKKCWTPWFDRDDPTGTGDWELLDILHDENPGRICKKPFDMEVVTTDMVPADSTGQTFVVNSVAQGFACLNVEQKSGRCLDYQVRFLCPCDAIPQQKG